MASAKVTFEVPEELRQLMARHPEVNWSAVFRDALVRHAKVIEIAKEMLDEDEDVRIRELTERLKRGVSDRYWRARARNARRG